jgi:hypothetical protein
MEKKQTPLIGYLLSATIGAVGGGLLVLVFTKAFPKMMTQMMSRMMAEMECNPAEI